MPDTTTPAENSAKSDAVQAVIDRVSAWQHGAPDGTVLDELRKGLDETCVKLDDGEIERLGAAIDADDGPVDSKQFLG